MPARAWYCGRFVGEEGATCFAYSFFFFFFFFVCLWNVHFRHNLFTLPFGVVSKMSFCDCGSSWRVSTL